MSEILKYKGRLAELETEKLELELRLSSLRDTIRDNLDPFADIMELKGDRVAANGMEFATKQILYKTTLDKIAAIKKALGR